MDIPPLPEGFFAPLMRMVRPDILGLLIQAIPSVFDLLMTCKEPQELTDSSTVAALRTDERGRFELKYKDFSIRDVLDKLLFESGFAEQFGALIDESPDRLRIELLAPDEDNFRKLLLKSYAWRANMAAINPSAITSLENHYADASSVDQLNALLEGFALAVLMETKLERPVKPGVIDMRKRKPKEDLERKARRRLIEPPPRAVKGENKEESSRRARRRAGKGENKEESPRRARLRAGKRKEEERKESGPPRRREENGSRRGEDEGASEQKRKKQRPSEANFAKEEDTWSMWLS